MPLGSDLPYINPILTYYFSAYLGLSSIVADLFPLPSNISQLLLGVPEAISGQQGGMIPWASSGFNTRSLPIRRERKNSRMVSCNHMTELPQLVTFGADKGSFFKIDIWYSNLWLIEVAFKVITGYNLTRPLLSHPVSNTAGFVMR